MTQSTDTRVTQTGFTLKQQRDKRKQDFLFLLWDIRNLINSTQYNEGISPKRLRVMHEAIQTMRQTRNTLVSGKQ